MKKNVSFFFLLSLLLATFPANLLGAKEFLAENQNLATYSNQNNYANFQQEVMAKQDLEPYKLTLDNHRFLDTEEGRNLFLGVPKKIGSKALEALDHSYFWPAKAIRNLMLIFHSPFIKENVKEAAERVSHLFGAKNVFKYFDYASYSLVGILYEISFIDSFLQSYSPEDLIPSSHIFFTNPQFQDLTGEQDERYSKVLQRLKTARSLHNKKHPSVMEIDLIVTETKENKIIFYELKTYKTLEGDDFFNENTRSPVNMIYDRLQRFSFVLKNSKDFSIKVPSSRDKKKGRFISLEEFIGDKEVEFQFIISTGNEFEMPEISQDNDYAEYIKGLREAFDNVPFKIVATKLPEIIKDYDSIVKDQDWKLRILQHDQFYLTMNLKYLQFAEMISQHYGLRSASQDQGDRAERLNRILRLKNTKPLGTSEMNLLLKRFNLDFLKYYFYLFPREVYKLKKMLRYKEIKEIHLEFDLVLLKFLQSKGLLNLEAFRVKQSIYHAVQRRLNLQSIEDVRSKEYLFIFLAKILEETKLRYRRHILKASEKKPYFSEVYLRKAEKLESRSAFHLKSA